MPVGPVIMIGLSPFPGSIIFEESAHDQSTFPCSRSRGSQATSPRQASSSSRGKSSTETLSLIRRNPRM